MISAFYGFLENIGFHQPIHPLPVRFTVGMVVGALIFALIARGTGRSALYTTARHALTFGAVAFALTVPAGLLDWYYYYGASWNHPIRMKMILSLVLLVLLAIAVHLNIRKKSASSGQLVVYALASVVVSLIVYYGGELAY